MISTLGVITYALWYLLFPVEEPTASMRGSAEANISSLVLIALGLLVTFLGLYLVHLSRDQWRMQAAWAFLSLAVFSSAIGECLWLYFESFLHIDPFPSIADIFYLLYYPLTLLGVLALPFAPLKRHERLTLYLDLGIILTSAAMVFWYYLVAPMQLSAYASIDSLVAISYPIGDLLLLACVAALVQRNIQRVARWTMFLFASGFIFNAIADTLYAYFENNGMEYSLAPLNILWMAWLLSVAYSFALQIRSREIPIPQAPRYFQPVRRLLQIMLPYAAAIASLVLLFIVANQAQDIYSGLLGMLNGSLALIVLVLARQYVVLRQNLSLMDEMRVMASTDSLTNIYNRHFFNDVFHQKVEQAERYNKPLTILLMDVDSFKQINDTFGHLKGDEVLREVARLLSSQLRSADLIARFGGDEFVVILPETDLQHAHQVAGRLKSIVASKKLDGVPMDVSIGIAEYRKGQYPEDLLEVADHNLYAQKSEKTQIRFHPIPREVYSGHTKTLHR